MIPIRTIFRGPSKDKSFIDKGRFVNRFLNPLIETYYQPAKIELYKKLKKNTIEVSLIPEKTDDIINKMNLSVMANSLDAIGIVEIKNEFYENIPIISIPPKKGKWIIAENSEPDLQVKLDVSTDKMGIRAYINDFSSLKSSMSYTLDCTNLEKEYWFVEIKREGGSKPIITKLCDDLILKYKQNDLILEYKQNNKTLYDPPLQGN
jgi:hypothetical protein